MEGETAWTNHPINDMASKVEDFESFLEASEEADRTQSVSLDVLPDDVLGMILAYLPIPSVFSAGCVCKRWNEIVSSSKFPRILSRYQSQKPWYFMFTYNEAAAGYAYDPTFQKWYGGLDLPCIEASNWFVSSSCGLICFMDNDTRSCLFVCNPMTKASRRLSEPPGGEFAEYTALSMSVDGASQSYIVVVVKSRQVPGDFLHWDLSIHMYDSQTRLWITSIKEVLEGWRGGDESVICNGVLYCLMHCTGVRGNSEIRHSVAMCDLSAGHSQPPVLRSSKPAPCLLTCARLVNLKERLVMVGGICKHGRPGVMKGIAIWELDEWEWREVSRMPNKFLQGFGEFDDVFTGSGIGDLIYIQSYGSPALLVFDMSEKQWKWSARCPATKRFPLQLFTGFCFEPRLEVSP